MKMGTSFAASIDQLGPYLRTLGMVSLMLVGLGMLLEAISGFIDIGYGAAHGYSVTTGDGIWAALNALLLVIAFLTIVASLNVKRGVYPQSMVLGALLLAAISLLVQGGGMLAISTSQSSWVGAAALAIAASVVLLIGMFFLMGQTVGTRVTGAIFILAFAALLIARLTSLGGSSLAVAPGGGYSLSSYLLYPFISFFYIDPGTLFTGLGIVGLTYLVLVAYLIVALGVIMYAILQKSKLVPVAWVVALVGFLLYGIDMAWGNIAALGNANWTYASSELANTTVPVITAIILSIASFIIIAASIVGIVYYGGSLAEMAIALQPSIQAPPTRGTSGTFCSRCGTQNPADHVYCKKCGTKL